MLLWIVIALAAGLGLGGIFAWLVAGNRSRSEQQRADSLAADLKQRTAELDAMREQKSQTEREKAVLEERLDAEKAALTRAQVSLSETFKALAADALQKNNQAFLDFAKQELGQQQQAASHQLESKEKAIETLLKPVGEALTKLQKETQAMEVTREGAYRTVLTEIQNIQKTHEGLRRETTQLIQALRAPKVRGNWGELQLKRCIEYAGMVEHASFDVEVAVRGEDVSIRPDCVIHLPNQRTIVIDVKTPFDAFLDAMSATDENVRALKLTAHAARVREHLSLLSAKNYWKQFKDSPDFVVCFLSSEVLFSAALEQDPGLIEYGSTANVILATPTTLIALLKAVAYGWQQMEITRNAIAIREAGEKLYSKLATTQDYFDKLGKALTSTVRQYNSLVGSVEGRGSVFSLARKLHELGIGQDEIAETQPLESSTRQLKGDEWKASGQATLELAAFGDDSPQHHDD
jgi:DNA recombination protein RmuC